MKRLHGQKELDQLQRIKKENDKLKRQVNSLRKQLARLDLDRYGNVKEALDESYRQDEQQEKHKVLDKLKEKWECHNCRSGYLKIIIIDRKDGLYYFRICNNCSKRTRSQKYHEKVEGIKEES